ncbi:MAG: helix-turn-helix domain-containing protein [Desulfobacterium sp.]|nr:helix-turn-helix domain-containing protein [Desulfobacterium sp.]
MARISMWTGEGCLFSSISTLMDAFSIANLWNRTVDDTAQDPLFEAQVLTLDGKSVQAYGGIGITPHGAISDVTQSDFIVISSHMPHVGTLPDRLDQLLAWIERLRSHGTTVGTVCTGSFILAEMGLLDGKLATTNWHFANLFRKRYPKVNLKPGLMMTEDQGIICTGAATAVHNLALHLIETFGSRELASVCAKALLVDPNRMSQAPYMISESRKNHGDVQVLKAQELMAADHGKNIAIDAIAEAVGISPRHFKRRFKKATGEMPLKYLQCIRIDAAKRLLETSRETIDEITWAVGYRDTSSFCRLFKQHTDLSPRAYRNKFFQSEPGSPAGIL